MPLLARQGPIDLSLDGVAARAGVTRNLLYHYFPGGRTDLITAVVDEAERQLLPGEKHSLPAAGVEETLSRILDHALAPTHAWRIHRMARATGQPAVTERVERSTREVASTLAAVQRPGEELTPVADVALDGYVAFAEAVLDGARAAGISREQTRRLLAQVLEAVMSVE
jgi:AcrR family transcriptional regulator